jgi:VanZ family protein
MQSAMPNPHELLHETRFRTHWRLLLASLVLVVAWFAFAPADGRDTGLEGMDKIEHLLAFGALGLTALCALPAGAWAGAASAAALLGYGGFIELVQRHIPGRTASWADLAADAVGVALGLWLAAALRRAWPPKR